MFIVCHKCGTVTPTSVPYCVSCGRGMNRKREDEQNKESSQEPKKTFPLVLVAVVALIMLVLIAYILKLFLF